MKIIIQSNPRQQNGRSRGFSMVEMVGVLAVIAIMAAMLTPKIMSTINDARLNATAGSLDATKAAVVNYYSKYGSFTNQLNFDTMLVTLEFLERPFDCRIGNGSDVQVVAGPGAGGYGYKFDGVNTNTASAGSVVECAITNVAIADAQQLSLSIDGMALSATNLTTSDLRGRVVYSFTSGSGIVYVYLAHR